MRKIRLTVIALFIVFFGCKSVTSQGPEKSPARLLEVKRTVAQLDSALAAMYGWEPRDSTYDPRVDTMVVDVMNQYQALKDLPGDSLDVQSVAAAQQKAFDQARETWDMFNKLIDNDQYEQALAFYLADSDEDGGPHEADFFVFLKHSSYRYGFESKVLLPLMRTLRGDAFAVDHYIDILQLEKEVEDYMIASSREREDGVYIPDVYLSVVQDLGLALAAAGRMADALELTPDLTSAVNEMYGNAIFANYFGTQYVTKLFVSNGDTDTALVYWEELERYLNEHQDDYTPEELDAVTTRIGEKKKDLLSTGPGRRGR